MQTINYDERPFLVLWELTRACTLACKHCRAKALRQRNPLELTFDECCKVMQDMQAFGRPLLVLTGGDPAQRPDLLDIVREAKAQGFPVAITPSATPVTTRKLIHEMKNAGVARLAVSIDGPDAETHDGFRRVKGSFEISTNIIKWAHEVDLPVQVNTTIARHNVKLFDEMAELVRGLDAVLWSLFFLVPTGRANDEMQIRQNEAEEILEKMANLAVMAPFDVKATEGPFFRRMLLERFADDCHSENDSGKMHFADRLKLGALRAYQSVNDGKGVLFISHTGDIYPSGFLPISAGNVRSDSVVRVYREHELFKALRSPSLLGGKCGRCKYKVVCGGSRARAYAAVGDYLAQDPLCSYGT